MADKDNTKNLVKEIVSKAETELASIDHSPFSRSAFSILKEKIAQYLNELVDESIKVSKRHQADTVSAAHVERASEYLVSSTTRRFFRHLGTVGGILLGGFSFKYSRNDCCGSVFCSGNTCFRGVWNYRSFFNCTSHCQRLNCKK